MIRYGCMTHGRPGTYMGDETHVKVRGSLTVPRGCGGAAGVIAYAVSETASAVMMLAAMRE